MYEENHSVNIRNIGNCIRNLYVDIRTYGYNHFEMDDWLIFNCMFGEWNSVFDEYQN